jgi:hypothetical protein
MTSSELAETVAGGAIGLALDETLLRRHADGLKLAPVRSILCAQAFVTRADRSPRPC